MKLFKKKKKNPGIVEDYPRKGFTLTLNWKKLTAAISAIITIMTGVITFSIKMSTRHHESKIEKIKAENSVAILDVQTQLKNCIENDKEKFKKLVPEYMYLRHLYYYTLSSMKYSENSTQVNLDTMIRRTNAFAKYVKLYKRSIVTKTGDPIMGEFEFSGSKIWFSGNPYLLPTPVKEELERLENE